MDLKAGVISDAIRPTHSPRFFILSILWILSKNPLGPTATPSGF